MLAIALRRDCAKGAPDFPSGAKFEQAQVIHIGYIGYPTQQLPNSIEKDWSFWTSHDIDGALIFDLVDVARVLITEDDKYFDIIQRLPAPVLVLPARGFPKTVTDIMPDWYAEGWRMVDDTTTMHHMRRGRTLCGRFAPGMGYNSRELVGHDHFDNACPECRAWLTPELGKPVNWWN